MNRKYARLRLVCILELVVILVLCGCIILLSIAYRKTPKPSNNTLEAIEPNDNQEPQTIAEKYPYADPSHAIFAVGNDRYTVDGSMQRNGIKVDYIGEVEFEVNDEGGVTSWSVDYVVYMPGDPKIWEGFKDLKEHGYNKAVIYGDIFEDGFSRSLMPEYLIIYDE